MFNISLTQTVNRFANIVQDVPDSELDREWAWGAYDSEGVRFAFFRIYEDLRELATKMARERSAHGPATSTAQRILAQYHSAYLDLQAALLGIEADDVDQVPAEGEWSPRQVLAHIVGADAGFYAAVKYALERHRNGDGQPAEIPENAWAVLIGEDEASFEAMLQGPFSGLRSYHQALHERVLKEFANITEAELAVPSMYWEGYALSLRFRLHRFDSHVRQHTIQIDKTLIDIGRPPNETNRLLRLLYAALAEVEGITIGAWEVGIDLGHETAEKIAAYTNEVAGIL